ncbi:esterase-like activity of phytase family protein [Propioniciclava soli]|uniref:esterase-like activity of phytase family protein n=1 Tax=Propioniciclava soli TaxID=2775081 RepID=UPI001E4D04C6|nr:esterase-like activity of phytase family protein [Propioniciclava soli]
MRILHRAAAGFLSAAVCLSLAATSAPSAAAAPAKQKNVRVVVPTLAARATLSADHLEEGPPSGALASPGNGRQGPWPGQVIPGFSAMIENADGTFWGMPDNGFGTRANSADFLLRLYLVQPHWQVASGGSGEIEVLSHISLRDPQRRAGFPLVNDATPERLLTGADFDIESVVRADDGTFWIGEEFGPFLLHFSADGVLLAAPVALPGGLKSPSSPFLAPGETPTVRGSKGFEALVAQGRYLYPILEGYLPNDTDKRRRMIYQFDTRTGTYTQKTWEYRADTDDALVGDAFALRGNQLLVLERDDFWGPEAVTKRVYRVNLAKTEAGGHLAKELVVDLLKIDNPDRIGMENNADAYGVGETFAFPQQSVETVVQLRDGRLLIANDNNYPGNDARYPGVPDDTEMIIVDLPTVKRKADHTVPVVAHRGASGYRPEHTLAAYQLAIEQCADAIEPDLVMTADGVLVDRHENEIGGTTDVATRAEFAGRRTTKTIDGTAVTGWFTEDFTLAELRTLRAKERLPQLRPGSAEFDGLYVVPTFSEVVDLARHSRTCDGQQVAVVPEIKHPSYFGSIGLAMEDAVVDTLRAAGLNRRSAPVAIQSFEVNNLVYLSQRSPVTLVQLVNCSGGPADRPELTYAQMVTRQGMRNVASYADKIGFCKDVMIPRLADGTLGRPTAAIRNAHRAGLSVVGWTFRAENQFLPVEYRSSANPADHGDLAAEIQDFLAAGMDEFFTDQPDLGVAAVR